MAWRVNQLDVNRPDTHDVARTMTNDVVIGDAGDLGDEFSLGVLHVDRHIDSVEQLGDAVDRVTHHGATHMVGVIVRRQHPRKGQPVLVEHVHDAVCVIGRIDDDGFARLGVADQVAEVHHLVGNRILLGEVSPREKLTKVQTAVHG